MADTPVPPPHRHRPARREGGSSLVVPAAVAVVLGLGAVLMIVTSLRRPELPTFTPTAPAAADVGEALDSGTVTVDARDEGAWRYFDFSRGSVVEAPGPLEWDVAFRRFEVMVNGGAGFQGRGGVVDLGSTPFEAVSAVPTDGYVVTAAGRDSTHPLLGDWYDYGFTTHVLRPVDRTWALRAADGRYAKLRFLSYYCPGATPGCVTFRWAYQGGGGTRVVP